MKTRTQVIADFERRGEPVSEWARRHGYNYRTVYAVLNGQLKGKYGVSHKIAVDLGLKDEAASVTDDAHAQL